MRMRAAPERVESIGTTMKGDKLSHFRDVWE
uniref:Uncharacterized protein n=1 Tax=Anguilla anguilla TaxID=7936 RepID=A0A0E9QCT0_ANGAN